MNSGLVSLDAVTELQKETMYIGLDAFTPLNCHHHTITITNTNTNSNTNTNTNTNTNLNTS